MRNMYFILLFAIFISFSAYTQLNDYKYIIVPKNFTIFKEANKYQTSTYLKYLFTNNGFEAIYDDALPEDLKSNGCLGLKAELENNSSLFKTKIKISVKDCNGLIVFTSEEGTSKEKDYKVAYMEAIKQAFISYQELDYKYIPKEKMEDKTITLNFKDDVKKLPADSANKIIDKKPEEMVMQKQETKKKLNSNKNEPAPSMEIMENKKRIILTKQIELLYAQPIQNGFQLVDSTPKVKFKLTETSVDNVFLASRGTTNGVVLQKNGTWFFEYTENGKKLLEELNVKF